jgi:hypothetical protein
MGSLIRLLLTILPALALFGCLSGGQERYTYTAAFISNIDTVYQHGSDDQDQAILGIGAEMGGGFFGLAGPGGSELFFYPSWMASWMISDSLLRADSSYPEALNEHTGNMLKLTPDSTYVGRLDAGLLLPGFFVEGAYAGSPCRFSNPRGFQFGPGGLSDTVPLVFSGTRLNRNHDEVYFAALLDTSASRAADARVRFTGSRLVQVMVDVNCPEP